MKPKQIDLNKLKIHKYRVQYSNKIGQRIKEYRDNLVDIDIESRWDKIKSIIRTSAEEVLQKEKVVPRKKWLTSEIINIMLDRRKLRNKKDEDSLKEYKKLTNKITLKCREAKEEDLENTCKEIEDFIKKGKLDKAYQLIKQLNKNHKTRSTTILDENGKILINNKDIVERWKQYIEKLYEGNGMKEDDIENEELVENDNLGADILRAEYDRALSSIQNGKAAGDDMLYIEMIKSAVCDSLHEEIYQLINKMYISGTIPKDFQVSKIVTLPKKQNTLKCEEYRTLSLISQASKILLKIIQNRIRPLTENNIGPDQYGFRKNKGTRDAILALRLIIDRRMDLGFPTYIAFIDLEKAFDKVNWTKMMKVLKDIGLDYRDRRIIYQLYKNQEAIIEIGDHKQKAFINQGVRQGCPLSPLIFNIFIECAIRKILDISNGGVKFNGECIRFIRFADDIAAIADSRDNLEKLLEIMDKTFKDFGLNININKTKSLTTYKFPTTHRPIQLNSFQIEEVNGFKYLGSQITHDSRCSPDIIRRIAMAKQAFNRKKQLFKGNIKKSIRKRLIKTYIWSIALYGCETWTLTQRDRERLAAFEMWCWRRMEKISWTERKTNEEVLQLVEEERQLLTTIETRRGKMIGHLIRHDNLFTLILEGKIEGRRGRGRPRRSFIQQVKEKVGVETYQAVKRKAEDREQWRLLHRQERSS